MICTFVLDLKFIRVTEWALCLHFLFPSFLYCFGIVSQLRRFDVAGIHKSSITALAWSPNGMKLFSGDDKGKIVYSALDLDQVSIYYRDLNSHLQFSGRMLVCLNI